MLYDKKTVKKNSEFHQKNNNKGYMVLYNSKQNGLKNSIQLLYGVA